MPGSRETDDVRPEDSPESGSSDTYSGGHGASVETAVHGGEGCRINPAHGKAREQQSRNDDEKLNGAHHHCKGCGEQE